MNENVYARIHSTKVFLRVVSLALVLLLMSALVPLSAFAQGWSITTLKLNEVNTITGASAVYDANAKDRLAKSYLKSYAPYVSVYRFPVVAGNSYTFITEYSGDGKYANVEVVGVNPLSAKIDAQIPQGNLVNFFGSSSASNTTPAGYTFRNNFTVSQSSTGSYLYVIGHFEAPQSTLKITLKSPALPNAEVEQSLNGGMTWGTYQSAPLYLMNLESTVPGAVPQKTVVFYIGQKTAMNNGKTEALDLAPYKKGSSTMVPLRYIGDKLGATVVYDAPNKQVTYTTSSVTLVLWLGKSKAMVNGVEKTLEAPPESLNGRLAVPLRFIGENLGASVLFDGKTQRITINQY